MSIAVTVVLGRKTLPIGAVLRMRRGAVVALDTVETDTVEILANGHPVARGRVAVRGTAITVEVTELLRPPTVLREPGATIGTSAPDAALPAAA